MQQQPTYKQFDPIFNYLFNSYYQAIGTPYPRTQRGLLVRPTTETICQYRQQIAQAMVEFINTITELKLTEYAAVIYLGLEHEQQHQELLYMDIKYNLSIQPDFPSYLSSEILTAEYKPSVDKLQFLVDVPQEILVSQGSFIQCLASTMRVPNNFLVTCGNGRLVLICPIPIINR